MTRSRPSPCHRAAVAGVVLLLATGGAHAADGLPARKPGLWEMTMQTTNAPSRTVRQCIDAKTDEQMQRFGQGTAGEQCTRNTFRKDGDRYVGESECRLGQTVATTRAVFAGDFGRAYGGEIESRYAPPLGGVAQSKVMITARWAGACPAGWKPGDMELPGMGRMNVNELAAGRAAQPKK